jgi:hypothetical protein
VRDTFLKKGKIMKLDLYIGQRVHYVLENGLHCTADVLGIVDEALGIVNLNVLVDLPEDASPADLPFFRTWKVKFSLLNLPGTWHWAAIHTPFQIPQKTSRRTLRYTA